MTQAFQALNVVSSETLGFQTIEEVGLAAPKTRGLRPAQAGTHHKTVSNVFSCFGLSRSDMSDCVKARGCAARTCGKAQGV
jgi:hypothetical protein